MNKEIKIVGAGSAVLVAAINLATQSGVKIVFNKRIDKLEMGGIIGIGPRAADAIAKGIIFNTTMEDIVSTILLAETLWKRLKGNTIHHF